ncbi:hypothetical protein CKAN_00704300 [Cinnamomum micranthum f. kanehirae]|uniref:Uncharacterized protein n=1 Tax=Cinnamomum micranthum f. kanehirae TaxID=337451 RepID=A0A3S3N0I2_9MAGN|nr:hypothetical protein CKAN_00704300 [Cinnamomum micranthum f. kanehirae]
MQKKQCAEITVVNARSRRRLSFVIRLLSRDSRSCRTQNFKTSRHVADIGKTWAVMIRIRIHLFCVLSQSHPSSYYIHFERYMHSSSGSRNG